MPINGQQAMAWLSEADDLFFGGAAGGGKTQLLLGLALTSQTRTLILRQEATQLQQIKDDLMTMKRPDDKWANVGYGGVLLTADGRKLEMSGCESFQAAEKYRGRAHDGKLWDEVCVHSERTFRFVNAWCRTADPHQKCRVVATGNPPTRPEEEWVIAYWAPWLDSQHSNPAEPGELRWFASVAGKDVEVESGQPFPQDGDIIQPRSRTFIPAKLTDNPILMATGYRAALQGLPEPLRSQLLYGDMTVGRADDDYQLIPTSWVRAAMKRWTPNGNKDTAGNLKIMTSAALDCAMEGEDRAAMAKRYDNWIAPLLTWPGTTIHSGDDIVQKVLPHLETLRMPLLVDVLATAGGAAVTALKTSLPKLSTIPVNFGAGSTYKDRSGRLEMANLRAEAYWRLREAMDPDAGPPETRLAIPADDTELLSEICAIRWMARSGRVQLEDKKEIKKRLGRSPDKADAVAMSLLRSHSKDGGWLVDNKPKMDPDEALDWTSRLGGHDYDGTGSPYKSRTFMGL